MIEIGRYRRGILAAYLIGLLAITLAPLPSRAFELASGSDKLVHFVLFAGFGVLLYWNMYSSRRPTLITVVGLTAVVAALIEVFQTPLPFRSGDVWDLLWGAVGGLVGCTIIHGIASRREPGKPGEKGKGKGSDTDG